MRKLKRVVLHSSFLLRKRTRGYSTFKGIGLFLQRGGDFGKITLEKENMWSWGRGVYFKWGLPRVSLRGGGESPEHGEKGG